MKALAVVLGIREKDYLLSAAYKSDLLKYIEFNFAQELAELEASMKAEADTGPEIEAVGIVRQRLVTIVCRALAKTTRTLCKPHDATPEARYQDAHA